jgi:hypothetical protein
MADNDGRARGWRLRREEAKTLSFEFDTGEELERDPVDPRDRVDERARFRHALELLSAVPERRRQIKARPMSSVRSSRDTPHAQGRRLLGDSSWSRLGSAPDPRN